MFNIQSIGVQFDSNESITVEFQPETHQVIVVYRRSGRTGCGYGFTKENGFEAFFTEIKKHLIGRGLIDANADDFENEQLRKLLESIY